MCKVLSLIPGISNLKDQVAGGVKDSQTLRGSVI